MKNGLKVLQDLASVPEGRSCAVIIRHADRGGAVDTVVDNEESLNDLGRSRAAELGLFLRRFDSLQMYSSPIGRCEETCMRLGEGYGREYSLEKTELLGMRAPFMLQPDVAYSLMRSLGLYGFLDAYVQGRIDRKVAMPCEDGAQMLLSYAIDKVRGVSNGVVVMVTHDMILTPPLAYYFDYDYEENGLVPFLEGIVLSEGEAGYTASYDGRSVRVLENGTVASDKGS